MSATPLSPIQLTLEQLAVQRSRQALGLASASLPHLSGLARLCRIKATRSVSVAAVGKSGLIVVHPEIFTTIALGDAAFILAHELMHLALDTHGRLGDANPLVGNFAHDYIINDILCEELERDEPPLDGLHSPGSREKSFEELIVELSQGGSGGQGGRCWSVIRGKLPRKGRGGSPPPSPMSRALAEAGLIEEPEPPPPPEPKIDDGLMDGDLLSSDQEADFEPELSPQLRDRVTQQVRKAAAKAASLAELRKKMEEAQDGGVVPEPQRHDAMLEALHAAYDTPWQLALQRWMDAVAPGERTYARPSRRGADRSDVVLPGRRREGWTLHIILDTSGSMEEFLPRALGAIAYFCESAGVYDVHIIQCDVEVTNDDWLEPSELDRYRVRGFGYSDMTPAMNYFAADPEITSVVLLTDGYIDILSQEPPYNVLWVLFGDVNRDFRPSYGTVIELPLNQA